MGPVTVETVISAPPEDVFDLLSDFSIRPSYTDHYLEEFRLARANPCGKGAAARFVLDAPVFSEYAELEIMSAERPRRIVEEGHVGRRGRSRFAAEWELTPEDGGTRVSLTTHWEPKTGIDRMRLIGVQGWLKRQSKKALDRLRRILEHPDEAELTRVAVAGYESHTAPRFGAHVPMPGRPADGG